jgi:hypothetical protein
MCPEPGLFLRKKCIAGSISVTMHTVLEEFIGILDENTFLRLCGSISPAGIND